MNDGRARHPARAQRAIESLSLPRSKLINAELRTGRSCATPGTRSHALLIAAQRMPGGRGELQDSVFQ